MDSLIFQPKHDISKLITPIAQPYSASEFHKRLVEMIKRFDRQLDQEHEVGMRLVSFGQTITFHVTSMGYCNPSLIQFNGILEDGSLVELIQHISQISFLLMAVKRLNPNFFGFCKAQRFT